MSETSESYPELIPADDDEARGRLHLVCALPTYSLGMLSEEALLRAWWSFFWLEPALHPDDARVWPEEVAFARHLAAEAYRRYQSGDLSEAEYYPNEMMQVRLRAAMTDKERAADGECNMLSWNALVYALSRAGFVIADDAEAVEATVGEVMPDGDPVILLTPYDSGESHMILKSLNEKVKAVGSSIFVTASVVDGDEAQEFQLSFYKTWVVSDDRELSEIK